MSMNIKNDEERKTKVIKIRLNESEFANLKRYTEESGLRSMSEYVYNSILATPIIEITDEQLAPIKARLRTIADSINAIAFRFWYFFLVPFWTFSFNIKYEAFICFCCTFWLFPPFWIYIISDNFFIRKIFFIFVYFMIVPIALL